MALVLVAACADDPKPDPVALGQSAKQRGFMALERGDYPAAEAAYREAGTDLPKDPYVQLNLGVVEQHLGKLDAARAAYQEAVLYGDKVEPPNVTDPHYAGRTIAQLANANLAGMALENK